MHFYRSIHPIKAITFDLDDTLYSNAMVVENAESALLTTLHQYHELQNITLNDLNDGKKAVLLDDPEIYHDVIVWRMAAMRYIFKKANVPHAKINQIIDESMTTFNSWRHKIQVPQATHALLTQLASKYPLGVITNGNVEIEKVGLHDYFQFSLRGGANGRSKPFPEIFTLAAQQLAVPAHQILHVGDDLSADINGAIKNGMQACWINIFNQDIYQLPNARCLPHIEITQLSELDNLL